MVSAGWIPFTGGHKEEHHPIIHDGVPLDTPEVQHARAEHLAAVAEAKAHAGPEEHYESHYDHHEEHVEIPQEHHHEEHHGTGYSIQHISAHHGHGHEEHEEHTSVVHHPHTVPHHTHPAYETSHHEPIVDHDGKPLDTPEVEKAKALHFAEVHKALARLHEHGHGHSLHRRDLGDYALHVEDDHSHGYELHQNHAPVYGHQESHYHHEVPQIGHDGKPLDTAEVEHAKALHFHAHQEALARVAHAKQQEQHEINYHY